MAQGKSGRLVADVNPEFKKQLHAALALSGTTFKDWVVSNGTEAIMNAQQPSLPLAVPKKPRAKIK
ncbi:MAG: hypothetical protein M0Q93_04620 [Terrimicrobiaceae bacterium]|nr:hypothetical protein [Terrimicrobiaceae bacterium]